VFVLCCILRYTFYLYLTRLFAFIRLFTYSSIQLISCKCVHYTSVSVSDLQPLDLDNFFLFNEKMYSAAQAYKNSRAANLMFSYELTRRIQDSGVKVYAICPGIHTDSLRISSSCPSMVKIH